MLRSISLVGVYVLFVAFLAIGIGAAPVQATTTWDFVATVTTAGATAGYSSFAFTYTDTAANPGVVTGPSEIGGGTGLLTTDLTYSGTGKTYDYISEVPGPATSTYTDGIYTYWSFGLTQGALSWNQDGRPLPVGPGYWTYSETAVPLPPSAFLLGSGLMGLVGWRRFRKS